MTGLQIFKNTSFGEIRTIENGANTLFVGSDVAKALGYARPSEAVTQHCRCTSKYRIPHPQNPNKTIEVNAIPQGDVLRLVTNSKLPSAVKFESWVFDEVIPSVIKTGKYSVPAPSALDALKQTVVVLEEMNLKITTLEAKQDKLEKTIEEVSKFSKSTWKESTMREIKAIAKHHGVSHVVLLGTLYKEFEKSEKIKLASRRKRTQERMKIQGHTYKECRGVSKLDVIEKDGYLKVAFESFINREW